MKLMLGQGPIYIFLLLNTHTHAPTHTHTHKHKHTQTHTQRRTTELPWERHFAINFLVDFFKTYDQPQVGRNSTVTITNRLQMSF